ncbi:MAG: response regulator, partial [Proteobacteria bacterium]
ILMDVHMPIMSGIEATRKIRKMGPKQPFIIAVTADASLSEKERCLTSGMDAFLTKPIDYPVLRDLIESHISVLIEADSLVPKHENTGIFNIGQIHDRFKNMGSVLQEVLEVYLEIYPASFKELKAAIDGNDAELCISKIHSMRGMIANFQAVQTVQNLAFVEHGISHRGITAELRHDLNKILDEITEANSSLKALLIQLRASDLKG